MNTGKVLLGVLAGVAAGAMIGLLFAPDKGSESRKKIFQKGKGYDDAIKEKYSDLLDSISEKFQEVKDQVSDFAEQKLHKPEEVKKA
jgi:gas vesicle protein